MLTQEQLEARRAGLGGSDIAGIIPDPNSKTGYVSPWTTAASVWLDKKGRLPPKPENEAMWWGSQMEALVARRFTELTGLQTVNHNAMIRDGVLLANLDRLIIPPGEKIAAYKGEIRTNMIFEAKTASTSWDDAKVAEILENGLDRYEVLDGWQGIPAYYKTQCYHYLGRVPTAEKIYLACRSSAPVRGYARADFKVYVLCRDDEIIKAQDEYARWWWEEYIVGDKIPEPTSEGEAKLVWRYATPGKTVVAAPKIVTAFARYRRADAEEKDASARKEKAKLAIEKALGEKDTLVADEEGKIVLATWKQGKDKVTTTTDWKAVAEALSAKVENGAETLKALAKEHTTTETKPGNRTFLGKTTQAVEDFMANIPDDGEDDEDTNDSDGAAPQAPEASANTTAA